MSGLVISSGSALHQLMCDWRRDLHAYPELAFEEYRTADKVAALLKGFGLKVHPGLAGTGVVGVLEGAQQSDTQRSVALRADMDALPIQELNQVAHCSCHPGKMHACGHDGHTAMLLGAAKFLSANRAFAGRLVFIFQPAEEGKGGARVMCEQGLFDRFPVDEVYGMHNWPGLPVGEFAVHPGPVMASTDQFDITIEGRGGHAAMPHLTVDPVLVAGHLLTALQSIVSRQVSPVHPAVVSVTRMQAGSAYNVIPETATLSGTCRTLSASVRKEVEARIRQLAQQIAAAFGASAQVDFRRGYPATINSEQHAEHCGQAASLTVGSAAVTRDMPPSMGGEDFAYMLEARPGAYIWIGNGETSAGLHNPHYEFNDEVLPFGASYWINLAQSRLR